MKAMLFQENDNHPMKSQDILIKIGLKRCIRSEWPAAVVGENVLVGHVEGRGSFRVSEMLSNQELHVEPFIQVSFALKKKKDKMPQLLLLSSYDTAR